MALAFAGCVTASDVRRSDALRELGLSYLNEGNTEGALRELINAKKINPKDARIRHELGLAFFAKDLYPQAEKEMLAAIKLDPQLTEAKLNLGSLYIAMARYEEAVVRFKEVTEDYLYRSPARAWNNLGWAYFKLGRFQEAQQSYEQALKIAPTFCQAVYNLAVMIETQEKLSEALMLADRAVNNCPQDLRFRLKLGQLQAKLDRRDEALKNFEVVATGDPVGALGAEAREYLRTLR